MAAFNWQSLLGKFVRNRELPQDSTSNAPVEPIRNFGVSETTAAVGLIIPAVASEEQDRRRIEQVDALWSAKLPTEVEQQWSRYPTSHPIVAAEINRRSSDDAGKDAYAHLGTISPVSASSFPWRASRRSVAVRARSNAG